MSGRCSSTDAAMSAGRSLSTTTADLERQVAVAAHLGGHHARLAVADHQDPPACRDASRHDALPDPGEDEHRDGRLEQVERSQVQVDPDARGRRGHPAERRAEGRGGRRPERQQREPRRLERLVQAREPDQGQHGRQLECAARGRHPALQHRVERQPHDTQAPEQRKRDRSPPPDLEARRLCQAVEGNALHHVVRLNPHRKSPRSSPVTALNMPLCWLQRISL